MSTYDDFDILTALAAADSALQHLNNAASLLEKAKNWGWVDAFVGGVITTMVKRNRMNDAQNELFMAYDSIKKLLSCVGNAGSIDYIMIQDVDGFVSFADFFLDNPIADFYIQSKIDDALKKVRETSAKISAIRTRLYELAGN